MISKRATRAVCTRLKLTRQHNPLRAATSTNSSSFSTEAKPAAAAAPGPDPVARIFQNFITDIEKGKGQTPSPAREDFSMPPVKRLLDLVRSRQQRPDTPPVKQRRPKFRPQDSDSDEEDFDARAARENEALVIDKKLKHHKDLLRNFSQADTLDEAHGWMKRVDKFENMHFKLRPEYRVIGELVNRLKVAEGKDRFILQLKLNRALKLVQWKEAFDPNDPANYSVLNKDDRGASAEVEENSEVNQKPMLLGEEDDDLMEFNDMKEKDNILLEKLTAIDKQLEERLALLDHTFGRKGKRLEEEIRDLAEERNSLTEQKRQPLCRKGFDVKLIDVNRTVKVTKGGQVVKYTALLACGNYQGVIGYAKAKAPSVPSALQKAHEKCYQNLHYVERHEDHTIAHAITTSYKKTKLYLWPASTRSGMKAGPTVKTILNLAGFKDVKSKVIGSHNPHNTVKAVFKALNAVETGKDVQEKFGRTVVESYLL